MTREEPDLTRQGPWLATAVICEKVLIEQDSVLSFIRVVDRVTQTAIGPEVPEDMPPLSLNNLHLVITLRAGAARGRHAVTVRPEAPSGQQLPTIEFPVNLEGDERGANLVVKLELVVDQEGLYWFDVMLSGRAGVLTRVPLRVVYAPQRQATS